MRTLQPTGSFSVTRLGKHFLRNKFSEYIAHVPVIIEGIQARGRNRGSTYQRLDWLPANVLGASQVMQNDALSEQDKTQNIKA